MKTLLPKTRNRRKTRRVILHAELVRKPRAAAWRLAIQHSGKRTQIFDIYTASEGAAMDFALLKIRELTRPSSQQPAASSQQPAASTDLI